MRKILPGLLLIAAIALGSPPTLAVWDPQVGGSETRFAIDREWLTRVAGWLKDGGLPVSRITADELADNGVFNAKSVAALFMPGDTVPRNRLDSLKRFANEGGVLVALDARMPWVVAMELGPDAAWRLSPREPKFAWQTQDLLNHLGLEYLYDPPRHDTGVRHVLSDLGNKYLAGAFQDLNALRPGLWVLPLGGARYVPLIRTRRADGADVVPLVAMVESGSIKSIVCTDGRLTKAGDAAARMVVGLGRLALDWHGGRLSIHEGDRISLNRTLPILGPLSKRPATGKVNPEGAIPLRRWGEFNGSDLDLPESAPAEGLPRRMGPGETAVMNLLPRKEASWLRLRLAVQSTGATLRVKWGGETLWHETLQYVDANGPGNYDSMDLGNMPLEITRCIPIPPGPAENISLDNPGDKPIFFDAAQVETRPEGTPPWVMGAMVIDIGGKANIPVELSKRWSYVRMDLRLNKVGPPGQSNRWDTVDQLISNVISTRAPLHAVLMGCPEFLAISAERYAEGKRAGRPHCVPPDPEKFAAFVAEVIARYGKQIALYEIWNEANIKQFYRGTPEEYARLVKAVAPVIRRLDPGKLICSAGMAGFNDPYVDAQVSEGAFALSDWFGFHPYAGKAPAWDVPAGLLTGKLYSLGLDPVIYWNEMGFPWKPGEWFQGTYNPGVQALLTDRALARFTATGATRLNLFHGGGLEHHFSLIDKSGEPYPAYRIFEDYLKLASKGGRRFDVSMTADGGAAFSGIYVAGAIHDDGAITLIVNPAEAQAPFPDVRLSFPAPQGGAIAARCSEGKGPSINLKPRITQMAGVPWITLSLPITGRTVILVEK